MKRFICITMVLILFFLSQIGFTETKKPTTATNKISNPVDISVLYNGKKISFNEKPYLIGKELMVPAEPFFKMLGIQPIIDKATGIYSFNFDGADVSFNPVSGNLTFAQHYMPYTTHKLTKTCSIRNKILYLNASKFPFCWLGAGADLRISSDGKYVKLYMSTDLKVVDEKFAVTNSRNGKVEKSYKKDPKKPLDVSWGINVSYEILPETKKVSIMDQSVPSGESKTEFQIFKYNGGSFGDIRSLLSSEMAVYDIMLYKNGNLIKTLHDFAPPRSGQVSSIITTYSEFDEIRFSSSYVKIDELNELFKQSGISIEVIDEESLIKELMSSSYFSSLSFYDAERSTPVIATNSLLNQGSTTYADGKKLITSLISTKEIKATTIINRTEERYDDFNSMHSTIKLTRKPHAIALYNQSLELIKVVYLN